jgi:hypothetical protein
MGQARAGFNPLLQIIVHRLSNPQFWGILAERFLRIIALGDFDNFAIGSFDQLKSRLGIGALPFPQFLDDMFHFNEAISS